jgi:ATP-dependent protease ClpP protease subunit
MKRRNDKMKLVERDGANLRCNIFGEIGADVPAAEFLKQLSDCGAAAKMVIYVDSAGGSAFDGLSIYTGIARHAAYKTTEILGIAASAASIIAMAADEVHMAADAFMMIHDPWTSMTGTAAELKKRAGLLEKTTDRLVSIYVRRTGLDPEKVRQMMTDETWLDASEAVSAGFVDMILAPTRLAAAADLSHFRHAPGEVQRKYGWTPKPRSVERERIVLGNRMAYMSRRAAKLMTNRRRV